MANQTITQLPAAGALTGTELVPIVQGGQTVQTTTGAISAVPVTNYSFITATSEGLLTDARQLVTTGGGITVTDNGAGSTMAIALSGAPASLVNSSAGIQVKTSGSTLTNRAVQAGTAGLSVADGDGISGDPTISLTGLPLNLALSSGTGLFSRTSGNTLAVVTLQGTTDQIDIANPTGDAANPTFSIADNVVLPGTGAVVLPKGLTADRLSPPVEGALRYNTQTSNFEGYGSSGWGIIPTGSGISSFSAGTTGFTPSTPTAGAITLSGTLITSNGGTGLASFTAGDTLYYAAGTALSKLAIGASSRIMTSSGTAPQWTDPATITVGTATSATTATNIAGGAAGSVPYQSGSGTTTFLAIGTATQILKVNAGATALEYADQSTLAVGTATNLAGGTTNQIAVQSNVGATTFITAPTVASTVLSWSGSAFQWVTPAAGTVTAVTASAPLASSGGATPDISLGTVTTANGGTGLTTYTAGDLPYYATGTALSKLGIGSNTYLLTSSGTAPQWSDPAGVTVGTATTATTANAVANSVTFTNTGGAVAGTTFNGSVARTIDYSTVGAPKADGTGASGTWGINISGSASSATSATTATNVAGGAAGSLVYQTGAATTSTLALGTQGYVLRAGASAPEWAVIDGGTF
jgi:hypothetical protein